MTIKMEQPISQGLVSHSMRRPVTSPDQDSGLILELPPKRAAAAEVHETIDVEHCACKAK